MDAKIGITKENRQVVSEQLAKLLADEYILYTKTRNAHWNIEGEDFLSKHKFFQEQYEKIDDFIDRVAERIRKIGHYAPATLKNFLALTHLTEYSERKNDSIGFIRDLLADHETVIEFIRGNIDPVANDHSDAGTSDFLTGLMEEHEEMAWFLRAHLK
ncbi:Dps family protein [Mucilaginibacter gynuensis]|uniref:Dps family protein n=1 Tax=Mucilaginibacter gynuensis TaxID=1302236 RepID=A0ABP8G6L2_9SPHI